MSDQPSLSRGGMSPEGRTNPVGTLEPRLDPQDKKVLCSAVCHCTSTPNLSQDGKSLKQACVAQRLGELDEVLQGRSPYKPEVSYDMTKNPPQPILDSQTGNSPHGWIPGWINKYWDDAWLHPHHSSMLDCSTSASSRTDDVDSMLEQHGIQTRVNKSFHQQRIKEWVLTSSSQS